MVVSMRPIPPSQLSKAVTASARFPDAHGAPIHIGDPAAIGIKDIDASPTGATRSSSSPGDVPVFWACGVTPQAVALASQAVVHDHPQPRAHVHHRPAELLAGGALRACRLRFLPAGDRGRLASSSATRSAREVNTPRARARVPAPAEGACPASSRRVPSFRSLLVYYDPARDRLRRRCAPTLARAGRAGGHRACCRPSRTVELPCCYDPELGFDLEAAAAAPRACRPTSWCGCTPAPSTSSTSSASRRACRT